MADIFREVEEDLQRDRLEALARRWGPLILGLVLVVVVATAGYVFWRNWQTSHLEGRTAALSTAARADDPGTAADALAAVAADEDGGGRGAIARLIEVGLRARSIGGAPDAATPGDLLAGLAGDPAPAAPGIAPAPAMFRDLALILRTLHEMDRLDRGGAGGPDRAALRARLTPLTDPASPWRHTARELAAVLAADAGDRADAVELLRAILGDPAAPQATRQRAGELVALYDGEAGS